MYGSYSHHLAQQSAAIEHERSAVSNLIANTIRKNGGRVTLKQLRERFKQSEIERAIELDRMIYPVTLDTPVGLVTYYEAN